MKRTLCFLIPTLLLIILFTNGCYNDNQELLYGSQELGCGPVQAKFGADISPLISSKCAISGCHDANAANNPAGVTLQTYAQISAQKNKINTKVVMQKTMPPTGPLLPAEIAKIKCWLEAGGQNN